jgi:hypothetical protein
MVNFGLTFAVFSTRRPETEASNEKVNSEKRGGSYNTRSLCERNENRSSQSSDSIFPVRKVVSRPKGSENGARAKRKFDTYDIADIIDSEVWYNCCEGKTLPNQRTWHILV